MRLGQLSRKLVKKPSEIVDFLFEQGIAIDNNSNAKVSDDALEIVYSHFDPEGLFSNYPAKPDPVEGSSSEAEVHNEKDKVSDEVDLEKTESVYELDEPANEESVQSEKQAPVIEKNKNIDSPPIEPDDEEVIEKVEITVSQILEQENEIGEELEEFNEKEVVIKPEKVHLPGLKVLGKIDIPEPKKKEETVEEKKDSKDIKRTKKVKSTGNKKSRKSSPGEVDFTIRKKREEKRYERKRKAEERKRKDQKKKYYEEQVKSRLDSSSNRKVKKKKNSSTVAKNYSNNKTAGESGIKKSKNVFQKFWKWLNT